MIFSKRVLIERVVRASVLVSVFSLIPVHAFADDLEDLLRQTDQALGTGGKKSDKKSSKSGEEKSEEPTKKSSGKHLVKPSAQPVPNGQPVEPSAPAKPVLTPTDADSVAELTSVGLRRESQLTLRDRDQQLSAAVGVAWLSGTHQLEKDDDTFETQSGQTMRSLSIAYTTEIGSRIYETGVGILKPVTSVTAGYMKGGVGVRRSGVQNGDIDVEYTLLPVSVGIGARLAMSPLWRAGLLYGPMVEMLIQAGSGNSDSTSGFFVADAFDATIDYRLTQSIWLGFLWQSRGILPFGGGEAGHNSLAITINTPLMGDSRRM